MRLRPCSPPARPHPLTTNCPFPSPPSRFWNFLLSFFAPKIAADIGPLILLIFAGVLIFGAVYVLCVVLHLPPLRQRMPAR